MADDLRTLAIAQARDPAHVATMTALQFQPRKRANWFRLLCLTLKRDFLLARSSSLRESIEHATAAIDEMSLERSRLKLEAFRVQQKINEVRL